MASVIRRLGVLFILALTLGACSGAERAAVTVGDEEISRADLYGFTRLVTELDQNYDIARPSTLSGDAMRQSAAQAVSVLANKQLLEQAVGEDFLTEDDRLLAGQELKGIIDRATAAPRVAPLTEFVTGFSPASPGYDYTIDLLAVGQFIEQNPGVYDPSGPELDALLQDVDVDRRIGIWDSSFAYVFTSDELDEAEAERALQAALVNNQ